MKHKILLIFLCIVIMTSVAARQLVHSTIVIGKEPKGVFSFTQKWDYPWDVIKDDNGKFHKNENGELTAKDTAHLYFTANCRTSVQGGYSVRYCSLTREAGLLKLNFSDGLPAYANRFDVFINGTTLHFKPTIIYPVFSPGQKTTYKVTRSNLTLYQKDYFTSKTISGYIDAEFTESVINGKGKAEIHKYYFKGYFQTRAKV